MSITKEQFHRAKYNAKMTHAKAGGDPCVEDWEVYEYPGMTVLRLWFVDGMYIQVDMTKYQRDFPRREHNESHIQES